MAVTLGLTSSSQYTSSSAIKTEDELFTLLKSVAANVFKDNVNLQDPLPKDLRPHALEHITALVVNDPDSPALLALRGEVYRLQNAWKEAFADFNNALQKQPNSVYLQARRGSVSLQLSDDNEAFSDLQNAYQHNPKDAFVLSNLAEYYRVNRQFDKSLPYCDEALTIDPKNFRALTCRADCHVQKNDLLLAEADGQNAYKIDSEDAFLSTLLGNINYNLKRWKTALHFLNKSLSVKRDDIYGLLIRAAVHIKLDNIENAISDLDQALTFTNQDIAEHPTHAFFWEQRAVIYRYLNLQKHSDSDAEKAFELNPGHDVMKMLAPIKPLFSSDSKYYPRFQAYCESVRQKIEKA
jgi:tetratricopeptide (TPR) repeat protein